MIGHPIQIICGFVCFLLFFFIRIICGLFVVIQFFSVIFSNFNDIPVFLLVFYSIAKLVNYCMNLYWFRLMINSYLKRYAFSEIKKDD